MGTFVAHVAGVTRAVLDRDRAAEHRFDRLPLEVEQRLGRREHRVQPPAWPPAFALQEPGEQVERAGVAVEPQGPVARDDARVLGERAFAEVERGDELRVDQPVAQAAQTVLPADLDRRSPQHDLTRARFEPEPAMGPVPDCQCEAHAHVDEQRDRLAGGASGRDALDPAQPHAGRGQIVEVLPQELARQDRHLAKVLQRLDTAGRDLVLVEEPSVVARVAVGELEVTPQLCELDIKQLAGVHPLRLLEALQPRERRRPLQALVQRQDDVAHDQRMHVVTITSTARWRRGRRRRRAPSTAHP